MQTLAESGAVESLTTAFTSLQTDIIAGIGAIAPIALMVMGMFLLWKSGAKFFKTLSH